MHATLAFNANSPSSRSALLERAHALAGLRLGELAQHFGVILPQAKSLLHAKGKLGTLLERALGASAGSMDQPDFPHLGIELKTLPVLSNGQPKESTFVATAPLHNLSRLEWGNSRVWRKLKCVLWVPIEADPHFTVPQRRIGQPFLWEPSSYEERILRQDWDELVGLLNTGHRHVLDGRIGYWLHVRPKAAHKRDTKLHGDASKLMDKTVPIGFYLRSALTTELLLRLGSFSQHQVADV